MLTSNYNLVAVISIICLLVNLLHLRELDLITKKAIRHFQYLAYFIILEIIIDVLFKLFEGNPNVDTDFLYLTKTAEFILNPILPLIILKLFNNHNHHSNWVTKWIQMFMQLIIVGNTIAQIISLVNETIYVIDDNNMYQRTSYTYIYAITLALCFVLMLIAIYFYSVRSQNINVLTLIGLTIMLSSGFCLKFIRPDTNFDWLCLAISFFIIDIYYVDSVLKLDPLTGLLNRQVYQTTLDKISFSTGIIMLDLNYFKLVNDNYGHECGDITLRVFAQCIHKVYGDYGWCFRIGGDEFCVILKPKSFKELIEKTPKNDVYLMIESLMEKLNVAVEERSKLDDDCFLDYGISQGYGIYYLPSEYPSVKNILPLDKVLKLADKRMYRSKKAFKTDYIKDHPELNLSASRSSSRRPKVKYDNSEPELIENSDQNNPS